MSYRLGFLLILFLSACDPKPQTPAHIIDANGTYQGPLMVTDVSQTTLGGTVIYDEVIPFVLEFQPASGPKQFSTRGALQSRVVRSDKTGNYIFAYRFRDLVFNPNAPQQSNSSFIELVVLNGYDTAMLPISHYDIATSQSLGGEVWGGMQVKPGTGTALSFEWNSFFTKPDGTTFTEFETTTRKFKTGKFMNVGDQALGKATLDKIAVPVR